MQAIASAREEYRRRVGNDPLAISEAATAGLMLSAAGQAGLLGLLEYPTDKRSASGDPCYGRCDLWILPSARDPDEDGWAFELKHRRVTARTSAKAVTRPWRDAWRDAGCLDVTEASRRIACTVYVSEHDLARDCEALRTIRKLATLSDWSWRLSPGPSYVKALAPAYVIFKERHRANRRV